MFAESVTKEFRTIDLIPKVDLVKMSGSKAHECLPSAPIMISASKISLLSLSQKVYFSLSLILF